MKKWSVKIFGIVAVGALACLLGMGTAGALDENHLNQPC